MQGYQQMSIEERARAMADAISRGTDAAGIARDIETIESRARSLIRRGVRPELIAVLFVAMEDIRRDEPAVASLAALRSAENERHASRMADLARERDLMDDGRKYRAEKGRRLSSVRPAGWDESYPASVEHERVIDLGDDD